MAYAVPQPVTKRLKFMEPSGREIREGWDPMDMSYMQLLDTANAAAGQAEEAPAEAEEAPPDPGEIIKVFEDAKGNLDIILDVVTNLERSFLEAKPFSAGRRPGVKRVDAVANSLQSRVAATCGTLGRVAARLRAGADALQAHADREDSFYAQLRQLQMFWKVHLNPRVIDCPFMVDLAFPEQLVTTSASAAGAGGAAAGADAAGGGGGGGAAAGRGGAAGGAGGGGAAAAGLGVGQALTGNTYELGSGSLLIPLMKDDGGAMRVQLELPEERPSVNDTAKAADTRVIGKGTKTQVVVGSRRVHALLLQLQRRQLWRQVASGLERDAAALGLSPGQGGGGPGGGHPVHVSLARLASQHVLVTPDPTLAALRPLMLEHLLTCRLPPAFRAPPPRPPPYGAAAGPYAGPGRALAGLPLLPELAALLNQMVFRDHQRYHLDLEAHTLPYVTLRWRPCSSSMLTSCMEIRVGHSHRIMLLVRDGRTDVEGVVQATGPGAGSGAGGSRWVRDTQVGFSRHDVPCVLRALLQTLGVPLERLLLMPHLTPLVHHHHGHHSHNHHNSNHQGNNNHQHHHHPSSPDAHGQGQQQQPEHGGLGANGPHHGQGVSGDGQGQGQNGATAGQGHGQGQGAQGGGMEAVVVGPGPWVKEEPGVQQQQGQAGEVGGQVPQTELLPPAEADVGQQGQGQPPMLQQQQQYAGTVGTEAAVGEGWGAGPMEGVQLQQQQPQAPVLAQPGGYGAGPGHPQQWQQQQQQYPGHAGVQGPGVEGGVGAQGPDGGPYGMGQGPGPGVGMGQGQDPATQYGVWSGPGTLDGQGGGGYGGQAQGLPGGMPGHGYGA